ncbi:putative transcription factor interactor and regulator Znf-B family [Helianthus debilis subsp. tardiflorus]
MKKCELCSHIARIYCHSDNACLCYNCDQTVHSSNFLVAKHSRTLLCHKCQSPTPWTASGLDLGRAATVCVTCLDDNHRENDVVEENRVVHETEETDGDDTESIDESDEDDEEEDEDTENQVVPWSSDASPPVTGCSSSEDVSSSRVSSVGFRSITFGERVDAYFDSEDDTVCSSDRFNTSKRSMETALTCSRTLKVIRSD